MAWQAIIGAVLGGTLKGFQEIESIKGEDEVRDRKVKEINRQTLVDVAQTFATETNKLTAIENEKLQRQRQALRERASINAAQGSAGVSGNTAVASLTASFITEQIDQGNLNENAEFVKDRTDIQLGNLKSKQERAINIQRQSVQNDFNRIFRIGKSVSSGAKAGASLAAGGG